MMYILLSCVLTLSKCFKRCTNSEKSIILIKVTVCVIWSPLIFPLLMHRLPVAVSNGIFNQFEATFLQYAF